MIEIIGGDVKHMRDVLRMKPGERVSVSSGAGTEYLCEVAAFTPETGNLRILETRLSGAELKSEITLYQGLPKGDKMDMIVQKAVELGAARIVPVSTARTVVKLDAKKAEARRARWQEIARSAAKQSGRAIIPEVAGVCTLREALADAASLDVRLLLYECAENMERTRELLGRIQRGQSVGVLIGPEGGFEAAEAGNAVETGFCPLTLGKRILRTETAGLCILSVLMVQLEE